MKTLMRLYLFTNAILRYREKQKSYLGISIFFSNYVRNEQRSNEFKGTRSYIYTHSLGGCYTAEEEAEEIEIT